MNRKDPNSQEQQQPNSSEWKYCKRGQLSEAIEERVSIQRRQFLKRTAAMSVTLMGGAAISTFLYKQASELNRPEQVVFVGCKEALENMDNYFEGKLASNWTNEIDRHLGNCESCKNAYGARSADLS